ncbi:MAG: right-handed parallel beta-helix repeat-containing protein [Gorillibacterium sp.]|nr:right-handed parallel beta-helix repeat-containing protein [Gorillibacterium sp.]
MKKTNRRIVYFLLPLFLFLLAAPLGVPPIIQLNYDIPGLFERESTVGAGRDGAAQGPILRAEQNEGLVKEPEVPSYRVELPRWGIHSDGTEPEATTKGINQAIRWARDSGYEGVLLPAGTYLISKDSRIELVSHMRFELDHAAVIQKESNSHERYDTLYIGEDVSHVTIRGGTYRGDREDHDYSSGETHEGGYGIVVIGGSHIIIEEVTASHFTGDGIYIAAQDHYIDTLYTADLEPGGIDQSGKAVPDSQRIRSINKTKTSLRKSIFSERRVIQIARPQNLAKDSRFDIFFYTENGGFLKAENNLEFAYSNIPIPSKADYYRVVFKQTGTKGVSVGSYAQVVAKDVVVRHSEMAFNRRQGISVSGGEQILIENNTIHDTSGTAPESGIDLEGGFLPNQSIQIKSNYFYNNKAYDIILFDGKDAIVEGNRIESKDAIGLASTELFTGAVVTGNTFVDNKVLVERDLNFTNNTLMNVYAKFSGSNVIVEGLHMTDSTLTIDAKTTNGVEVNNVRMINHLKQEHALIVNGSAVKITNLTITGPTLLRSLTGSGAKGTVFTGLRIVDYNGIYGLDLPQGTYRDSFFQSDETGDAGAVINQTGRFIFVGCQFISAGTGLTIANAESEIELHHSSIKITASIGYGKAAIYVQAAQGIALTNNEINAEQLTDTNLAIIKINEYGASDKAYDVKNVLIKGNRITTNLLVKGISTIDAGIGAPPYDISDNKMTNAELELRVVDIKEVDIKEVDIREVDVKEVGVDVKE